MERESPGKGDPPRKPGFPRWSSPFWYLPLFLLLLWMWQSATYQLAYRELTYSEFKEHLRSGHLVRAVVKPDTIEGEVDLSTNTLAEVAKKTSTNQALPHPALSPTGRTNATQVQAKKPRVGDSKEAADTEFSFRTTRVEDPNLVEEMEGAGVRFRGEQPSLFSAFFLTWIIPIGLVLLLWIFISRRLGSAGESIMAFGKSKARFLVQEETGVTFDDVAGCEEAKYELQEVVDFLKHPERYKAIGAAIPKGVLLVGPPGTGKTLLAKAVAGEAHVPFYSLSGSDFVEMFVGVGAARVRDLFMQAKAKAPCIIFIDELDAIGRQRGVHVGAVNDEREQTLNQLLVEMDGFAANAGVILLAATNRPDVLDRALLRPGRFDRQVVVDAPDLDGRLAILRVHVRGKRLAGEVELRRIAQATPGFSGADLANTVNEAALLAARRHAREISQKDLEDAVEKVVAGPERKTRRLKEDEKRRVAYHEAGHALVAAFSKGADPVHKISIIPRGRAALGYTMQLPTEDQFLMSHSQLADRLRSILGGRAAEQVVFGEATTGAENDLEQATALARQMVCVFGMNERVGLARCAQPQNPPFLPGVDGNLQRDCSERTAQMIDEEVKKILDQAYSEAQDILITHRDKLEAVTAELLRTETIDAQRFARLLGRELPSTSQDHRGSEEPAPAVEAA